MEPVGGGVLDAPSGKYDLDGHIFPQIPNCRLTADGMSRTPSPTNHRLFLKFEPAASGRLFFSAQSSSPGSLGMVPFSSVSRKVKEYSM